MESNTSLRINNYLNIHSQNYYHKIIGSSVFGFEDFSILNIEGFYLETLKGSYEHFSQFLCNVPEALWKEKFIVWEGFVYSIAEKLPEEIDLKTEILIFEGTFRRIRKDELMEMFNTPQCELFA